MDNRVDKIFCEYDKCNKKEKLPTQKIGNPKDAKTTRKKFKSKSKIVPLISYEFMITFFP